MNINDYFDKVYVINLESRPDRLKDVSTQLSVLNIEYEIFNAIDGNKIVGNKNKITRYEAACLLSHLNVIKLAKDNNYDKILILEDDVLFLPEANELFSAYIERTPDDWDMLYFGGNHNEHMGYNVNMVSDNICKCYHTFSAHAYAIKKTLFQEVIDLLGNVEKQVDVYYSDIQKYRNVYAFYPGIATQKSGFSNINNKVTDYKDIIK